MKDPDKHGGRIAWLDFLRVFALLAVIVIHTTAGPLYSLDPHTSQWRGINFYNSIVHWAVPVFVMISGALFLDPNREVPVRKLFRTHIARMVLAFAFWSFLYAVIFTYLMNPDSIRRDLTGLIARSLSGHSHLWFLFMIVGLYLLVPLLRRITASWRATRYFLLLSMAFTFIFPFVLTCLRVVEQYCGGGDEYYQFASGIFSKVVFQFTLGYTPYFVGGYYLKSLVLNRRTEWVVYLLGLGSAAARILLSEIAFRLLDDPEFFSGLYPFAVMLQSAAVFVFAKCRLRPARAVAKLLDWCGAVAKYGFGIYLIHYLVLELLRRYVFDPAGVLPAVTVPLFALAVYGLSLLVVMLLYRIPVMRKYFF